MSIEINEDTQRINIIVWDDADIEAINALPEYTVRGTYFPQEFVDVSGRIQTFKIEKVATPYFSDDGTFIVVIVPTGIFYLSAVQVPDDNNEVT